MLFLNYSNIVLIRYHQEEFDLLLIQKATSSSQPCRRPLGWTDDMYMYIEHRKTA